jgi:hypothetical protein
MNVFADRFDGVLKLSGRRGSNSRPIAWKAIALPAELLPQLCCARLLTGISETNSGSNCGGGWIRTTVGVHQQIYSLPHLATLVHPLFQHFNTSVKAACFTFGAAKLYPFLIFSNSFPKKFE